MHSPLLPCSGRQEVCRAIASEKEDGASDIGALGCSAGRYGGVPVEGISVVRCIWKGLDKEGRR